MSKLDAIIDFSGIGEFIDVPVKRYSSGMYVRLAYAVASLLQSEIMILDEVLAVGDAAFREKSEQNIKENALSGRTVLLVSHNPSAVATICDRAIILYKGRVVFDGEAKDVMSEYLSSAYKEDAAEADAERREAEGGRRSRWQTRSRCGPLHGQAAHGTKLREYRQDAAAKASHATDPWLVLKWVSLHALDGEQRAEFSTGDGVRIRIGYESLPFPDITYFSVLINNSAQDRVTTVYSTDNGRLPLEPSGVIECVIPELMLGVGLYNVWIDCGKFDFEVTCLFQL